MVGSPEPEFQVPKKGVAGRRLKGSTVTGAREDGAGGGMHGRQPVTCCMKTMQGVVGSYMKAGKYFSL